MQGCVRVSNARVRRAEWAAHVLVSPLRYREEREPEEGAAHGRDDEIGNAVVEVLVFLTDVLKALDE